LHSAAAPECDLPDHAAAIRAVIQRIGASQISSSIAAIGHRVVHGGGRYTSAWHSIDEAMLAELNGLIPLAPEHLPQSIAAIQAFRAAFPTMPQVACFDTAFHRTLTPLARQYPLPHSPETAGIVRYGFHGLSCESIMDDLHRVAPGEAAGRIVIAHLGNGASMTAVRDGKSIETTMGFTPAGGLMMGTRTGDIDPGVLLYLLSAQGMTAEQLRTLVNKRSGLKGVSGSTSEMRELLDKAPHDSAAANAVDLYCYLASKQLGGLVAVLGGLDTLVFTGGVGENAASVRSRICAGFEFAGVSLDERSNATHKPVISRAGAGVTVRVVTTDEDRMIARHTLSALQGEKA
jgi:acetate kinase